MKQFDYCKIFGKLMLLTTISDTASPFKLTLDVEADLVECPLKTFASILAHSNSATSNFFISFSTAQKKLCSGGASSVFRCL